MNSIFKKIVNQTNCHTGLQSRFCIVLGLQWGKEGKNKLLNKLCHDYDYSVRYNGGKSSEPCM